MEDSPSLAKPASGSKDLITLTNIRNGETYKFAWSVLHSTMYIT